MSPGRPSDVCSKALSFLRLHQIEASLWRLVMSLCWGLPSFGVPIKRSAFLQAPISWTRQRAREPSRNCSGPHTFRMNYSAIVCPRATVAASNPSGDKKIGREKERASERASERLCHAERENPSKKLQPALNTLLAAGELPACRSQSQPRQLLACPPLQSCSC